MSEQIIIRIVAGGKKWDIGFNVDDKYLAKHMVPDSLWQLPVFPGTVFKLKQDSPHQWHLEQYMTVRDIPLPGAPKQLSQDPMWDGAAIDDMPGYEEYQQRIEEESEGEDG